ncbi:hypothetical protein MHU86_10594 [Fragilaria crotonensis]|nr:hypothetical protein MHU86_10594 [Fragilaria crotonensis]
MSDADSVLDSLMDDATGVSFVVVSSDERASRHASPLGAARVEGVVRSVQGTKLGGKMYSVVSVSGVDRSVCFGLVGAGGASFCIKKNCAIRSHEDMKVSFQGSAETCIFIRRGGVSNSNIFSEPCVDERQVPTEVRRGWMTQQMTLGEWARAFRAVENAGDAATSVEEIKREVTFLEDTSNFRTPSKKRKEGMMNVGTEGFLDNLDFVGHVRTLPEDLTKELDDVIGGAMAKGLLTRIVARLESSMVIQGSALEAVAESVYKRFLTNERDLRTVSGAVQNVQTSVGQPIELDTRFDAPTLWSSTSFVAEEVIRVTNGLVAMEGDLAPLKARLETVNEECGRLVKAVQSDKMLKVLVMVSTKVKEASMEIVSLKAKVSELESEVKRSKGASRKRVSTVGGSSFGGGDEIDELMDMFGSTDVTKDRALNDSLVTPEKGEWDGRDRVRETEDLITNLTHDLKLLAADVVMLKAGAEDKSVKFAGLGWRSILDCQEWIKGNFPSHRYGLIMDPLLMLDRVFGSDDAEADSQFKTLESRVKLKIATGAEAAAIKALYFKRPRLFHKGQVSMSTDRNKSKLNKLTDHKVWKAGGEGVHTYVVQRMNLLLSTISQDIGHVLGGDPKAQLLATMCLNATITFVTQLLAFVDTIYDKLVVASKFTAEQGWSLTMKILDRICEDLFAPKEGVAVAMNVEDPASICAHMLWSCFKTHDVMATYMEFNFENHPAISAEYVKFLATNSGFDKVERLEATVTGMKSQVDKAATDAAKARSIADGSASAASATAKALAELVKRVGKVEDRGHK